MESRRKQPGLLKARRGSGLARFSVVVHSTGASPRPAATGGEGEGLACLRGLQPARPGDRRLSVLISGHSHRVSCVFENQREFCYVTFPRSVLYLSPPMSEVAKLNIFSILANIPQNRGIPL